MPVAVVLSPLDVAVAGADDDEEDDEANDGGNGASSTRFWLADFHMELC